MAITVTKRPKDARQFNAWLAPRDHDTLEDYRARKGLRNRTEALRLILKGVRTWLKSEEEDEEEKAERRLVRDRHVMGLEPAPAPEPMPPVEVLHDGGSQGATIARYTEPEPTPEPDEVFEEELPDDVWAGDPDGPPRGHPAWTDLYCDANECRRRQWRSPGGAVCDEGHGGAPGSPWDETDEAIRAAYQTDEHHRRTDWNRLERHEGDHQRDDLADDVREEEDDIP